MLLFEKWRHATHPAEGPRKGIRADPAEMD